jgi:hypothetical protein
MREILGFLGVDRDFYSVQYEEEYNTRTSKEELSRFWEVVWNEAVQPVLQRLPSDWSTRVGPRLRHAIARPVAPAPEIPAKVIAGLTQHLREEVDELREITNQTYSSWSV